LSTQQVIGQVKTAKYVEAGADDAECRKCVMIHAEIVAAATPDNTD
jgi:hypothetical protein